MYENFYGFERKPFQLLPNADFLFRSKKHDIALTYLEYGIYDRAGFIVITGEIGTGKTTLLNYLLRTLRKELPIVYLSQTYLEPEEFLRILCQEFSLSHEGKGKSELIELFGKFLVDEFQKGRHVIVILDEAQNLPLETLEEIRMLSNLDAGNEPLLQIILVGQPTLREKLRWEGLRQLAQRVEVSYHLGPLDLNETKDYIRFRIEKAGGTDPELFTDDAIEEIYNYSKGIPRLINAVCHMCLVYGMADEQKKIDRPLVLNVLKDRSNWDLIPADKESQEVEKDSFGMGSAFTDTLKIEGILKNLDAKLGSFVEIAHSSRVALEEIVARLPEGKNPKVGQNQSEESMVLRNQWKELLSRLNRIEKVFADGVENQKRLLGLLTSQKEKPKRRIKNMSITLGIVFTLGLGLLFLHLFFIDLSIFWDRVFGDKSLFGSILFK